MSLIYKLHDATQKGRFVDGAAPSSLLTLDGMVFESIGNRYEEPGRHSHASGASNPLQAFFRYTFQYTAYRS
jgi:hypothetical protein